MNKESKKLSKFNSHRGYFLSFENSSTRLEIMNMPDIVEQEGKKSTVFGFTHLAISVGSKQRVDELTEQIRDDGYAIASECRTTGDGYYESVILDPEGNLVEITV